MASADVDICNLALLAVGHKQPILALTDATTEAQLCNILYPQARDFVLSAAWWPFATKHATLALLSTTRTGWTYAYALPSDCLQPRYISNGTRPGANLLSATVNTIFDDLIGLETGASRPPVVGLNMPIPFTIESSDDLNSDWLLTDQPQAELLYTAAITNVRRFSAPFVEALTWALAAKLALGLPVDKTGAKTAMDAYKAAMLEALASDLRSVKEDQQLDAAYIQQRG